METENWKEIWERKGTEDTTDLRVLDGSERHPQGLDIKITKKLVERLGIKKSDRVLEVGCGAGMLAQHLRNYCNYIGIDYSISLIKKHEEMLGNEVYVAEANNLPFEADTFDAVFSWGVFLYFPNQDYARQTIAEMKRVCKNKDKVYVGDLPIKSHRKSHLLFKKTDFDGKIFPGFWLEDRFDVLLD